jgi:glycosyltransferase involved in cell wall biosynthesis
MATLWVIAPVFNEEQSLEALVRGWLPVLRAVVGSDFIFCLLNDGSTDGSLQIMTGLAAEYPELRLIDKTNTGHGPTCLRGYNLAIEAGAEWVLQIDSDGQCAPADFETFWRTRESCPVHYGYRRQREDGWVRRLISRVLVLFLFLLSGRWLKDPNGPYRLMRREALKSALPRIPADFRLANVLLSLLQDKNPGIQWQPISFLPRAGRQNPVRLRHFGREAMILLRDYAAWAWHNGNATRMDRVLQIGRILLGLLATYYLLVFPVLALLRAHALVEYDWVEGVHLSQVHRFLEGKPLYVAPSLEYTPVLYGPLYTYVSAVAAFLFGKSYTTLRLVSLAATLGTEFMIARLVWRQINSRLAAWVAAGLYAGMYGIVGFWFDLARVDSLFIFFTMAMVYYLWVAAERGGTATLYAVLAATGAVLTKQTALVPVFVLCLWSLSIQNPRARFAALLCLSSVLLSQTVLTLASHGWSFYYLYELPAAHPILKGNIYQFLQHELLGSLSFGVALSLWALFMLFRKNQGKQEAFYFLCFFLAMVVASLAPRFKIGGNVNNLMPFSAALAVCCGLMAGMSRFQVKWCSALIVFLLLAFNLQVFYWPGKALPSARALQQTQIELDLFRSLGGRIFAPCHAYLPILAKKNGSAFWGAIFDVWLTPGEESDILREKLRKALVEKQFQAIVLPNSFFMQKQFPYQQLEANYQKLAPSEIITVIGNKIMLPNVYVPMIKKEE